VGLQAIEGEGMKRVITLIACALPLAFASAATASPAIHETADPTGDVFVCGGETYTITGGTLKVTLHEDENAAGGFNFTSTIVPQRVTAVNSSGDEFRAVGAVWFGATGNPAGSVQSTFTFKIQLVSVDGGKADSVNLVAHESTDGSNFFFDHGTCEEAP
jgi:hypothetical protein